MTTRIVKWHSAFVILVMVAMAVPQTASAEELPTVTITEDIVLTADLNAHVVIGADGITLDGAGYSITRDDVYDWPDDYRDDVGISLIGRSGVTIKNCRVIGWFTVGIYLEESSHNKIINNTVDGSYWRGFYLYPSGVYMDDPSEPSDYNIVTDNIAIRIGKTDLARLYTGGFAVSGQSNIVTNNTAIDIDGFGFSGNDLRGNTATGCHEGFSVHFGYIEGNLAYGNRVGFSLESCRQAILVNNTARNNGVGFELLEAYYNLLVGNNASDNTDHGFYLITYAYHNKLFKNVALGNGRADIFMLPFGINHVRNNILAANEIDTMIGRGGGQHS